LADQLIAFSWRYVVRPGQTTGWLQYSDRCICPIRLMYRQL